MCEICRKYLCPPSCPSFVGISAELGIPILRCTECQRWIYDDDDYIIDYGKPYCLHCKKIYPEENTQEND